jgi:hypothetical protein
LNRRLRIFVAVEPRELSRVILHLLGTLQEADIVCSIADPGWLLRYTQRLLPHLIIATPQFCKAHFPTTIDAVRNASPGVKVIITSPGKLSEKGNSFNADARLSDDTLVDQLIPTVRRLCAVSSPGFKPNPKGGSHDVSLGAQLFARRASDGGRPEHERGADLRVLDRLRRVHASELLQFRSTRGWRKLS